MKHSRKTHRKSFSKSKRTKKSFSKSKKTRTHKKHRFSKKRTHKGGYGFFERMGLKKYANDPEVQLALEAYFNETNVVGNPAHALEILKANDNLYPSITDLLRAIGVGENADYISKEKLRDYADTTPAQREAERKASRMEEAKADEEFKRIEMAVARTRREEEKRRMEDEKDRLRRQQFADSAAYLSKSKTPSTSYSSRSSGYSGSNRQ
jgi:hypothetical protein